jgi:hypothetical protein
MLPSRSCSARGVVKYRRTKQIVGGPFLWEGRPGPIWLYRGETPLPQTPLPQTPLPQTPHINRL